MPFIEESVSKHIEHMRATDPEFKKAWDESRTEYRLIGEMTRLQKNWCEKSHGFNRGMTAPL